MRKLIVCLVVVGCGGGAASGGGGTTPEALEAEARPLAWGETRGTLAACDTAYPDGRHVHVYTVDLAQGERVRLELHAGFDAVLEVHGPDDLHAQNDDSFAGNTDSMLLFTAPEAGTYQVRAQSLRPRETGPYRLVATRAAREGEGRALPLDAPTTASLTVPMAGALAGAWFRFEAQQGSSVRLRVTSAEFDTVATVIGPDGNSWTNDDANELGADGTERPLDSTLVVAAPRTGVYQLIVSSYGNRGTGAFRVVPTVRPPVVLPEGQAALADGFAGPDLRGRIVGVFAGVTAYQESSQLYGCADDARLLAEALRASRLMDASAQQVLADAEATRAAFLAAIGQLAARARPEDLAIVFWSGHGNVQPAAPGDTVELDGTDETMQLFDGRLTDNEVVAALAQIRAGTIILAMDACHSGGFADDFVTGPGRIGLFSSDSDVLSDTAEPRRAGGYLSYWLRMGVLGAADARPRDGFLQAGELTDYLYQGFVRDHASMNPEASVAPLQRLVVARGSIPHTHALWAYPRNPTTLDLYDVPNNPLQSAPPPSEPAETGGTTERCD